MQRAGLIALVVVALIVAIVALSDVLSQPPYVPVGDGLALGPAAHHPRAVTDVFLHAASGALDAAAGNAGGDLERAADDAPTPLEQELLELTNADRTGFGVAPLAFDAAMLKVARARAAAQIPDGPLSHYNNLGDLAFVGLLGTAGVDYLLAGENLARSSTRDQAVVARLGAALMNSPGHRANILEPAFDRLAVGAASGPEGRIAFAEIFRAAPEDTGQAAPALNPR